MADLLVGARRAPRTNRSRTSTLALAVLVVCIGSILTWVGFRRATDFSLPPAGPTAGRLSIHDGQLTWGTSSLERRGGLWIARLKGDPFSIGLAHGRLLGDSFANADGVLLRALFGLAPLSGLFDSKWEEARLRWHHRLIGDGLPNPPRQHLLGMAEGQNAERHTAYRQLVLRQVAFDMGRGPDTEAPRGEVARSLIVATKGTDGTRLARALSIPQLGFRGDPVVFIVTEDQRLAYVSVGWSGLAGALTGMNETGLTVLVAPASSDDQPAEPPRMPVVLLARQILSTSRTRAEAVELIKNTPTTGAASFVVADAQGWVTVDRSPERVAVREESGPLVLADQLESPTFAKDAHNERVGRAGPGARRKARLRELIGGAAAGKTRDELIAILRDRQGPQGLLPLGHGLAIDDMRGQAVVLEPDQRRLWVSEGPGAVGRFLLVDLKAELAGTAQNEAPHPADGSVPATEADNALAALALLDRARVAQAAGDLPLTQELLLRAQGLAPQLGAVYKLAGDLARAKGDSQAARAHYIHFLAQTPERTDWAEQARAYAGTP